MLLLLLVLFFSLTFWLGIYLLHRDRHEPRLLWTGLGLVSYAIGIGFLIVNINSYVEFTTIQQTSSVSQIFLSPTYWWLLSLPALLWTGAAIHLLPDATYSSEDALLKNFFTAIAWQTHLMRFWRYGQLPIVGLLAPLFLVADVNHVIQVTSLLQIVLASVLLVPLALILILITYQTFFITSASLPFRSQFTRPLFGLLLVAALFFGISMSALLLPFSSVSPFWIILGMGGDLMLLGFVIVWWDAFNQGETFKVTLFLSLGSALLHSMIFGGMVAIIMYVSTGCTLPMLLLLLMTIAAAIIMQAYAGTIQAFLDRMAFAQLPLVREERAVLRAVAEAVPKRRLLTETAGRIEETIQPANILLTDEDELIRVTRRALSALGDIGKLAISPLMQLDIISQKLAEQQTEDNTLRRSQELQALLFHAIEQLRPANMDEFGTTGQWRYYNALYYPYVMGIKPYSRRVQYDNLDDHTQQALEWFRAYVPERTLYNWQTVGAKLVAQYLREAEILADEI